VGVWHLNTPATGARPDATGHGLNATPTNYDGSVYKQNGIIGGCDSLNGNNEYLSLPSDFSNWSNGITFYCWAYPTGLGMSERFMEFGNDSLSDNIVFSRSYTSSDLVVQVINGNSYGNRITDTTNAMVDNQWGHYAFSINGTSVKIYKNGIKVGGGTSTLAINNSILRSHNWFGHSSWGGDANFMGKYDEIAVANVERSADWINLTYQNQKSGQTLVTISINEDYTLWGFNKKITLNTASNGAGVTGNVYNFPVLVRLNPNNFSDFKNVQAGGVDIRFAKADGTHLPYTIERWINMPNNQDTAEIWVKVDTVLGNNATQTITMYYGKSDVIDNSGSSYVFGPQNGWVADWHMDENPTGSAPQIRDATGNAFNGTAFGSMQSTDLVSGIIGNAIHFNGTNDYIDVANATGLNPTKITVSAWVNPSTWSADYTALVSKQESASPWKIFDLRKKPGSQNIQAAMAINGSEDTVTGGLISTNTWQQVAFTYDGETINIYNNGTLTGSNASPSGDLQAGSSDLNFGRNPWASRFFNGSLDEIEISNVARDSNWIKLAYQNQRQDQPVVVFPPQPALTDHYQENFQSDSTLDSLGIWFRNFEVQNHLLTTTSPGGLSAMSQAYTLPVFASTDSGIVTATWQVAFPTQPDSGKIWKYNNQVLVSLDNDAKTPLYQVTFMPHISDTSSGNDLYLFKRNASGNLVLVASTLVTGITPSGTSAAPVNFKLELNKTGTMTTVKVSTDNGPSQSLTSYITYVDSSGWNNFSYLEIKYATGTVASRNNYYVTFGPLSINGQMKLLPLSQVAYVNNYSVFTQDSTGNMSLEYENLLTPSGVEGRVQHDTSAEGIAYYYLKDHLGSTRVVISEDNNAGFVEATVYHSYGSMEDLINTAMLNSAREKFTGKEFDQDGPRLASIVIDIEIDSMTVRTLPSDFNGISLYFDDSTSEITSLTVNDGGNGAFLKRTFEYPQNKKLTGIFLQLDHVEKGSFSDSIMTATTNLSQYFDVGESRTISLVCNSPMILKTNPPYVFGDSTVTQVSGLRMDYFGKRYYDPEIGAWTSTDPANQYWNPYLYAGCDPINNIDRYGSISIPHVYTPYHTGGSGNGAGGVGTPSNSFPSQNDNFTSPFQVQSSLITPYEQNEMISQALNLQLQMFMPSIKPSALSTKIIDMPGENPGASDNDKSKSSEKQKFKDELDSWTAFLAWIEMACNSIEGTVSIGAADLTRAASTLLQTIKIGGKYVAHGGGYVLNGISLYLDPTISNFIDIAGNTILNGLCPPAGISLFLGDQALRSIDGNGFVDNLSTFGSGVSSELGNFYNQITSFNAEMEIINIELNQRH
jgi:RHS repeat-associated protein